MRPRTHTRRLRLIVAASLVWASATAWTSAPSAAAPLQAARASGPSSLGGLTWSRLGPLTRPPALEGASATFDPVNQTIVLFGGRMADGQLSNQTWVWTGSNWNPTKFSGSMPPARTSASMAFDPHLDQLILFGGLGNNGALLDDTWSWNGASWNRVTAALTPGAREGAALAADAAGHLVLFGGYGTSNGVTPPPPTTTTTTTTPKRHHKKAKKTKKKHHAPRATTTTTSSSSTTSDPPSLTTTTSSTLATSSVPTTLPATTTTGDAVGSTTTTSPSTSIAETAAITAQAGAGTDPRVLDDTWILSKSSDGADQWSQATSTTTPPARTGAAMVIGPGAKTVLFGGTSRGPGADQRQGVLDDTWLWNGHSWSAVHLKSPPPGRMSASIGDDIGTEGLGDAVLFGGLGTKSTFADTWSWDGGTWQLLRPASPASARSAAAAAFDAQNQQFVVYGGLSSAGAVFDDTQVLITHPPKHLPTSRVGVDKGSKPTPTTTPSSSGGGAAPKTTTALGATSASVHRGDVITLTGSGFVPGAEITITFHSTPVLVSRMRANKQGAFSDNVTVPNTASGGSHHFEATGLGPKGQIQLVTPVRVIGVSVSHTVTRWIKLTLVGIALAIPVASWFVLGALGRRRRAARV